MTNAPTLTEKSKQQRDNIKNATKNFDCTTIADRLRTVSWSNSSYPTDVVKPVYERSTFPLTATAVLSKGHTFKNFMVLDLHFRSFKTEWEIPSHGLTAGKNLLDVGCLSLAFLLSISLCSYILPSYDIFISQFVWLAKRWCCITVLILLKS